MVCSCSISSILVLALLNSYVCTNFTIASRREATDIVGQILVTGLPAARQFPHGPRSTIHSDRTPYSTYSRRHVTTRHVTSTSSQTENGKRSSQDRTSTTASTTTTESKLMSTLTSRSRKSDVVNVVTGGRSTPYHSVTASPFTSPTTSPATKLTVRSTLSSQSRESTTTPSAVAESTISGSQSPTTSPSAAIASRSEPSFIRTKPTIRTTEPRKSRSTTGFSTTPLMSNTPVIPIRTSIDPIGVEKPSTSLKVTNLLSPSYISRSTNRPTVFGENQTEVDSWQTDALFATTGSLPDSFESAKVTTVTPPPIAVGPQSSTTKSSTLRTTPTTLSKRTTSTTESFYYISNEQLVKLFWKLHVKIHDGQATNEGQLVYNGKAYNLEHMMAECCPFG